MPYSLSAYWQQYKCKYVSIKKKNNNNNKKQLYLDQTRTFIQTIPTEIAVNTLAKVGVRLWVWIDHAFDVRIDFFDAFAILWTFDLTLETAPTRVAHAFSRTEITPIHIVCLFVCLFFLVFLKNKKLLNFFF